MKISPTIAALSTLLCLAANTGAEPLSIVVEDNRFPGFPLYVAVYAETEEEWQAEPVAREKITLPEAEQFTLPLDLAPARYAIRAFIDLNRNGQLDTNRRERPTEPFAHSTEGEDGRPSHHFDRSVFILEETGGRTALTLRYPKGSLETSADQ